MNRHDSDLYCPTSIKYTMKWFHFLTIMEHTANIMNTKAGMINSLLKIFAMFELRLIGDKKMYVIAIRCIICKKETGLYLQNSTFE